MKHEKLIPIIKWFIYAVLLLLAYTLQTIPGLFSIFGVKPILLLPIAICVSMYEGVMGSAVFCMISGLLWDISSDKLFGFNGVILLICGAFFSLMCIYYLRTKLVNAVTFCALTLILQGLLDYVFYYALWGYQSPQHILFTQIAPTALYTLCIAPLMFLLVKSIAGKFHQSARS